MEAHAGPICATHVYRHSQFSYCLTFRCNAKGLLRLQHGFQLSDYEIIHAQYLLVEALSFGWVL